MPADWPCQRIVAVYERRLARWLRRIRRRPADYVACGLLQGHDRGCSPFDVGGYLRAPLVHPLDLWPPASPWRWRCPAGCPTSGGDTDGPTHDMHHDGTDWVLHDVVLEWRFSPCGHTFRTICPRPDVVFPNAR